MPQKQETRGDKQKTIVMNPMPALLRFYTYGIQGFCDEILFTSLLDFYVVHGCQDWRLRGHSSISTFFIYGTCSFLVERLYVWLYYKHNVRWYIRMPLYLCICYSWEFSTGIILRQFDACPWDYSHYPYNFMGLITLEYAPGWLFLSWVQDVLADYMLRIRVIPPVTLSSEASPSRPNISQGCNNDIEHAVLGTWATPNMNGKVKYTEGYSAVRKTN